MQVFPTAPSPTVTHLMNFVALILAPASYEVVAESKEEEEEEEETRYSRRQTAGRELLRLEGRRSKTIRRGQGEWSFWCEQEPRCGSRSYIGSYSLRSFFLLTRPPFLLLRHATNRHVNPVIPARDLLPSHDRATGAPRTTITSIAPTRPLVTACGSHYRYEGRVGNEGNDGGGARSSRSLHVLFHDEGVGFNFRIRPFRSSADAIAALTGFGAVATNQIKWSTAHLVDVHNAHDAGLEQ
ncbi:hypothetical protein BHM03_00022193 [Ensete ventricosum]|nr:hypothetical protein BHM03_00022193 [Ensete ventricosum]